MDFPIGYNCAQKVAYANQAGQEVIDGLAKMGGGRAPGGLCGALYSALRLSSETEHERIKAEFSKRLGAETCRELKAKGVPCPTCIATAIELLKD